MASFCDGMAKSKRQRRVGWNLYSGVRSWPSGATASQAALNAASAALVLTPRRAPLFLVPKNAVLTPANQSAAGRRCKPLRLNRNRRDQIATSMLIAVLAATACGQLAGRNCIGCTRAASMADCRTPAFSAGRSVFRERPARSYRRIPRSKETQARTDFFRPRGFDTGAPSLVIVASLLPAISLPASNRARSRCKPASTCLLAGSSGRLICRN